MDKEQDVLIDTQETGEDVVIAVNPNGEIEVEIIPPENPIDDAPPADEGAKNDTEEIDQWRTTTLQTIQDQALLIQGLTDQTAGLLEQLTQQQQRTAELTEIITELRGSLETQRQKHRKNGGQEDTQGTAPVIDATPGVAPAAVPEAGPVADQAAAEVAEQSPKERWI